MADYFLECADCGKKQKEDAYYISCPTCGGFMEVALMKVPEHPIDTRFASIFKYHPVMPYDPLQEDIATFEDYEDTPIFLAEKLSEMMGIELLMKDETIMPTGTWKDREGFVSIHRLLISKVQDLVIFSSGNTGTSLSRSASIIKGPRLHIIVPNASKKRMEASNTMIDPDYVKFHYFEGSNDECSDYTKIFAAKYGYQGEGGFTNYARREGLKLFGLEVILNWKKPVDWYVQPIAGGIGIYSFYKAYRDLGLESQCPKMLGVQAEICAPMVNAWKVGSPTLEEEHVPQAIIPSDYVRVLRTRKPRESYPILKKIMDKVNGRFESVTDRQIHDALRLFYQEDYFKKAYHKDGRLMGLEPATALAGIVKGVQDGFIRSGEKVLLNVSGAAKVGDIRMEWISDLL